MTIGYGGLKKGLPIELDGEPYVVVDYERSKKEQRAPVARIRFKSLRNGKVLDKSFNGFDVKFTPAEIERREAQFLYGDGEQFYFMDEVNYEQYMLSATLIEFAMPFLIDQLKVDLIFYKDDVRHFLYVFFQHESIIDLLFLIAVLFDGLGKKNFFHIYVF